VLSTAALQAQVPGRIAAVDRARSIYSTSFPIDDLVVTLADGSRLELVHKDLAWEALLPGARRTKPRFLYDPGREIAVYRDLLDPTRHGTARCYGVVADEGSGRFSVLLEKVNGVELYQVGDLELWQRVARWLAAFHAEFAPRVAAGALDAVPLLAHDADFYRTWPARAARFVRDQRLDWLVDRYDEIVDRLVGLPTTLVHGEFYASNVLVSGERVCPVDWEMAAIGPAMTDLAALTTGGAWSERDRASIAAAYGRERGHRVSGAELDACRVGLALQWLGWAEAWTPPPDHAHDWLAEAVAATERLGL